MFCVEFLKQYKDVILDRVVAKDIAVKLFDKGLLPESVVTSIRNADSEYNANSILWSHASKHYEFQSCLMLCAVMERENRYPKMKILGTRMREELEKCELSFNPVCVCVCVCCVCVCVCVCACVCA